MTGDIRTWMLLVLALLPTWAVLAGAGWLWTERGEEIERFESVLVPVETTYELFVVSSRMLRAEASLQMAALDDATEEVVARAEQDHAASLMALRDAQESLGPLIDQMDPDREELVNGEVLTLLGDSVSLAIDLFEEQVPGEPVAPELTLLADLSRQSAAGLVLPFVNSGDPQASYLYDALTATVEYHDQFDRDRASILSSLAHHNELDPSVIESGLRTAVWKDVTDSRTFVPSVASIGWLSTAADPQNPLLLDVREPLGEVLAELSDASDQAQRTAAILAIQQIDDHLETDVDTAYREISHLTEVHRESLAKERELTALTSCLMAFLGLALAGLTISEVRHRRRVEAAHDNAMKQLSEKADRDPSTGAWNRRRLESAVIEMVAAAPALNETVVLAYIDLDHFKAINDVWGHSTGDFVLREVTDRLTGFSYEDVAFELCRFGGDEFVLFAQMSNRSLSWFEGLGHAIIDAVDSEMEVNGRLHEVGASIGIASSTEDSTLDSLLLEADSSLLLAKRERGTAVVYNRDVSRTGELVHALPFALASGEILAHIQPVVDLHTGDVVHVEALARWSRDNGEEVSPGVFVPLVESYGLAEKLTTTVLESVQQLISAPETPDFVRVWINVSPRELDVANFADRFVSMLRNIDVEPTRIGLEITETAAVRDPERLAIELRRLREVGISVAIDDFGSGYSPLGYLRLLPVDVVKVDRTLIANIDVDAANQHIVLGIVGLVHELGMSIVAEGVEREGERQWLADHGVQRVQGFLFDAPKAPEHFDWEPRTIASNSGSSSDQLADVI